MDAVSPNAQCMLQSLFFTIFRKARWCRFSHLQFVSDIGQMVRLLRQKGYLSAWWRATCFAKAEALDMGCMMRVAWAMGTDE